MKHYQIKIIKTLLSGLASLTAAFTLFTTVAPVDAQQISGINVYNAVPGLSASDKYSVRVCATSNQTVWKNVFTLQTSVNPNNPITNVGSVADDKVYYKTVAGWSHSYVNFEMTVPVTVEITKIGGTISTAAVHPARKANNVYVTGGKAYLTMNNPCNVAVDIDGQMNTRDTGDGVGAPIHTISIHGNPVLAGKPAATGDQTVLYVTAGTPPPTTTGTWTTMYFLPGKHDLGKNFPLYKDKQYYIPGDAIVYGGFCNNDYSTSPDRGTNIRVFGHGTISGEKIEHWKLDNSNPPPPPDDTEKYAYKHRAIDIENGKNARLEGITITDPSYHSIIIGTTYSSAPSDRNLVSWVKTFTWRVNGDGGGGGVTNTVSNCFERTQDDSLYISGSGLAFSENVLWSDVNGSAMRLTFLPNTPVTIDGIDVIYARHNWWSGSSPLQLPADYAADHGNGVVFSNITISDLFPNGPAISIHQPVSVAKPTASFSGATFRNVLVATSNIKDGRGPGKINIKNELIADPGASIHDLTFDNLVIGGTLVTSSNWTNYFTTSGNVYNIFFANTSGATVVSYTLAATANNGTVMLNPPGGTYLAGTEVAVTAVPNPGNLFSHWSSGLSGTTNTTIVTMNGNKSITASTIAALPRTGWVASASSGYASPALAIDGNVATRWDTNAYQVSGQTYQVDMGSAQTFSKIVLDTGSSPNDYARSYQINVSNDGVNFGTPVASGIGAAVTTINFSPQTARYIKVTQTGSSTSAYWSIHEFYVYASLPSPWLSADVGTGGLSGSANYNVPTWTITGSGADIWNTADTFRYVYQASSGDCSVVARVASLTNTNAWAKTGVMIRESTAAGAMNVMICVTPGNGVSFQWRGVTNGAYGYAQVTGQTAPKWLRITRTGNSFTGYYSADGTTWTQVGTAQTIAMANTATIGLAVCSHTTTALCTSTMDSVTATP